MKFINYPSRAELLNSNTGKSNLTFPFFLNPVKNYLCSTLKIMKSVFKLKKYSESQGVISSF